MKNFHEWSEAINNDTKPGQELVERMMGIPLVFLVPALEELANYARSGGDKKAPVYKGGEPESKTLRSPGDGPGFGVSKALDPEEWRSGSEKEPIESRYNWRGLLDAFARVANQVTADDFHDVFGDAEYSAEDGLSADEMEYQPVPGDKSVTMASMGLAVPEAAAKPGPAKTNTSDMDDAEFVRRKTQKRR